MSTLPLALRSLAVLLVVLLAGAFSPSWASSTGKIAGRVTDASTGQPLPGVNVVLVGTTQGAMSDGDGYYQIIGIRPGTYAVRATYIGYASTTIENVGVIVDKTTRVDVSLREQVVEGEEVVVVAERPLIQIDRTTTTAVVDADQIQSLPVVSINDVVNLQAGVVDGHFRGGRIGEVAVLVNGVPITNAFNRQASFEVEANMVQSLEVISGVFNAEYGQATSGVINIVTKDVPTRWGGDFLGYVGAIASTQKYTFLRRNVAAGTDLLASDFEEEEVSLLDAAAFPNLIDTQISLGGPILKDRLGLQVTGRYFRDNSFLIARNLFAPGDSSYSLAANPAAPTLPGINAGRPSEAWRIASTGDGEFVPRNNTDRWSVNSTLGFKLNRLLRMDYNLFLQGGRYIPFSHDNVYTPDGMNTIDFFNQTHILGLRFAFGSRAFANLSYSYLHDRGDNERFASPFDPGYVVAQRGDQTGSFAFNIGGNDLFTARERTTTHTVVGDYSLQANRLHLLKTGFQVRFHEIENVNFGIQKDSETGFQAEPSRDIYNNNALRTRPLEFAAYVQDKMEFEGLIVNAGLRFDLFDPDYSTPVDWTQPDSAFVPDLNNPGTLIPNRQEAPVRAQLSPRLGIAFPISATGVMRFSAGLFFQVPPFFLIYSNPEFELNPRTLTNQFGNPALDPERTLAFEVGLQQGLTESLGMEMTLFSKDVRNLTGQEIIQTTRGDFLVRWINRDFGTIRGLTLSFFQRPAGFGLNWTLDYTLQFAEGTSSDPGEALGRQLSGLDPNLSLTRLNWDRRHVFNTTVGYRPGDFAEVQLLNRLQSGTPYTTIRNQARSTVPNNADRPLQWVTDMRVFLRPPFFPKGAEIVAQVQNLFDIRLQNGVYDDTGRADESETLEDLRQTGGEVAGLNSLDAYFQRQDFYGAPRRVSLGLSLRF